MTTDGTPASEAAGEREVAESGRLTLAMEYVRADRLTRERAAYDVAIGGRVAARLACVDGRWRLQYAEQALTLASPLAAAALIERFADRIRDGRPLEVHEPTRRE